MSLSCRLRCEFRGYASGDCQGEEPEFYIWPKYHPNVEYDATVSSDYIYLGDSITCIAYLFPAYRGAQDLQYNTSQRQI
jgi:hypothetical protein